MLQNYILCITCAKKKLYGPFLWVGVQLPQDYSHFKEAVYFLPLSSQEFLVLILSTSEGWKAELILEPPSSFEHETPGFRPLHQFLHYGFIKLCIFYLLFLEISFLSFFVLCVFCLLLVINLKFSKRKKWNSHRT